MIGRRKLLAALASSAALPRAVRAQSLPIIGIVSLATRSSRHIEAFVNGLTELGRVPGKHLQIEERYAAGDVSRLKDHIAGLLKLGTSIFLATGDNAMLIVQEQAPNAAIVVAPAGNYGNLTMGGTISRPGGNVTGFALLSADLAAKRLQLLGEVVPGTKRVTVLSSPQSVTPPLQIEAYRNAGQALGIEVRLLPIMPENDLVAAFAAEKAAGTQAIVGFRNFRFEARQSDITMALTTSALPSMFEERFYVKAGGLMAYTVDLSDLLRRAAGYVVKILDGAKPSALPIELPSRFELIINRTTVSALGLTIPPAILIRADEVIE